MSEIIHIDSVNPDSTHLDRAADILLAGGLVVSPTETRYGLLANACNGDAVSRLCQAKGRDFNRAVAVFVDNIHSIREIAVLDEVAERLARTFLPGPLTLVLKATVNWPSPLVVDEKIGIRISTSPVISQLVRRIGPLTATSANMSGFPDPVDVTEAREQLGKAVDLYLDAGNLSGPVSTVVDCSHGLCHILRAGAIEPERIVNAVKELQNSE